MPGDKNVIQNEKLGYGYYFLIPNTYTFAFNETSISNWYETTNAGYTLNLNEGSQETVSFGIHPFKTVSSLQTFINYYPTRCNKAIPFTISIKNTGTTFADGILWFKPDDATFPTEFIHKPDTTNQQNEYGWHYNNLAPSHTINKKALLTMPGVTRFNIGDSLFFESYTI